MPGGSSSRATSMTGADCGGVRILVTISSWARDGARRYCPETFREAKYPALSRARDLPGRPRARGQGEYGYLDRAGTFSQEKSSRIAPVLQQRSPPTFRRRKDAHEEDRREHAAVLASLPARPTRA